MYFNYTKYNPIVFQLQNTNYFCQDHKIQNTLNVFKIHVFQLLVFQLLQHIIIRCCCGKQCELLLNRFLIKDLHHKLNLLCHLPLSSIIDDKIRPHTSFSTPCRKNISTPPPRLSTPHLKKNFDPPTSFWTIRTLQKGGVVLEWMRNGLNEVVERMRVGRIEACYM